MHASASSSSPRASTSSRASSEYIGVHLDDSRPDELTLLMPPRRERFGGSLGASVLIHAGSVLLMIVAMRYGPIVAGPSEVVAPQPVYDLVWIPQEGPGGGGGGGGNQSPDPPRKLQLPGKDAMSVPVEKPAPVTPPPQPKPETEPPPLQALSIPAQNMASGLETLPGALRGNEDLSSLSQGPGTGGGAGTGRGTGIGEGQGSGLGPGYGGGTGGGAYRPGSGVTTPRILREVKPQYTADAMRAKVQGTVWLDVLVLPDGTVGNVEVVRSLDAVFGLDQEAVKAARQWRFVPGTRQGQPVPVLVTIEMSFTLR